MHSTKSRAVRALLAAMMAGGMLVTGAGPVFASAPSPLPPPPEGRWTRVGDDAFEHFACRSPRGGGSWDVSTATYRTDPDAPPDIGVYAAVVKGRGEDAKVVDKVDHANWDGRWLYTNALVGSTKRNHGVWVQGSYYGPPAYEGDLRIALDRLKRCA